MMEDGVSIFFSCGQTEFSSSGPNTKFLLTAFPAITKESAVSVNDVAGGWRVSTAPSPVLTVLIVVNQRRCQFPLQLYGLMCQTSNSSQQLLIAGHRQGHVATGGGTSAIRQHVQLFRGPAVPLSYRCPKHFSCHGMYRRMRDFYAIRQPVSVRP